ncbi:family 78 glycoside hydrolase catalytic domain [Micrococcales bacterium 31B]|nr:family 78 glycoside hydrolase catalytic domain [Micrococcales bacterium 31B]
MTRLIAADDFHDGAPLLRSPVFTLDQPSENLTRAVLEATALALYEPEVNGRPATDTVFNPGWDSYEFRVRLQSFDVTHLLSTETSTETTAGAGHRIGARLGNGWAHGRLGFLAGGGKFYTDEPAFYARLTLTFADGAQQIVETDETWEAHASDTTDNQIYDGQTIDARRRLPGWSTAADASTGWTGVHTKVFDEAKLFAQAELEVPPVRRIEAVTAREIMTTPSGKTVLDFGQNLVGWCRFTVPAGAATAGHEIVLRHAEVLEAGELGVRPLRTADCTDRFVLSGGEDFFEPTLTFHGFRYAEVTGWPGELGLGDIEAVVVHSDMRRTGTFECSDELVNQLHRNIVWGLRGNFLDVPTDCPQRDERLGWTGDIAVFAPTAAYLYDVRGFLGNWLANLAAEQADADGFVAAVVPDVLKFMPTPEDFPELDTTAIWSDASVWVTLELYRTYGDAALLARQFDSMAAHVRRVVSKLSPSGLWDADFQFGDWLDPDASPHNPADAKADKGVVATACLVRSAREVSEAAEILGLKAEAAEFSEIADVARANFLANYVDAEGRVRSDCATVYALAIHFDIVDSAHEPQRRAFAGQRLAEIVAERNYRVSTGFAGTPYVTWALSATGHVDAAYRLLLERECPSWLYPVTMGATTVWERWDSMLPDGSINPGEMTSFNHYALGAVADWLHKVVGGLSASAPGYASVRIAPQVGGGLTWAATSLDTAHGVISVRWDLDGDRFTLTCDVPAGVTAEVMLPDATARTVGTGAHRFESPVPVA